jgi:hypothetical protein
MEFWGVSVQLYNMKLYSEAVLKLNVGAEE